MVYLVKIFNCLDPILEIIEPQNTDEIFIGHTITLALGKTS